MEVLHTAMAYYPRGCGDLLANCCSHRYMPPNTALHPRLTYSKVAPLLPVQLFSNTKSVHSVFYWSILLPYLSLSVALSTSEDSIAEKSTTKDTGSSSNNSSLTGKKLASSISLPSMGTASSSDSPRTPRQRFLSLLSAPTESSSVSLSKRPFSASTSATTSHPTKDQMGKTRGSLDSAMVHHGGIL